MKCSSATIRTAVGITILATLLSLYYLDSRIPRATATVQVHPDIFTDPNNYITTGPNHKFTSNDFASSEILLAVSKRIELKKSDEDSLSLLKKITTITPVRGSDIVKITVKHSPREEAVQIANAIAECVVEYGIAIQKTRATRTITILDKELEQQHELVDEHRKSLTVYIQSYFAALTDLKENNPDNNIEISPRQEPYNQLKKTYEQSRDLFRELKIKQQETRTLLKTPHPPITIHERAQ